MKKKIGLIVDSAFDLTLSEANERGHAFIPMQVIINGNERKTGVDLTTEELLKLMNEQKKDIVLKTSLPKGEDIEAAFEWILERYERAIYIGVSNKMSGTYNAIRNFINSDDKYKDKIYCYKSEYSSPWSNAYLEEFEEIIEKYDDFEEISKILDLANPYMVGHLSPEDIYWFYKGGRLSKMQYMVGSLLKVKPVLTIANGTLDTSRIEKVRGIEKAMDKIINIVYDEVEKLKNEGLPFKLITIKSSVKEYTETMIQKVIDKFKIERKDILVEAVSTEQTAHMGPGAFGLAALVKLKDLIKKEGLK